MDVNSSLSQTEFFDKYYKDALIIRAICDDFNFPAEYSPVFVNIHVRGPEHFLSPPLPRECYKIIFQYLNPSSKDYIKDIFSKIEDGPVKKHLKEMSINNRIEELEKTLPDNGKDSAYLSSQLKNIEKLYFDKDYMNHMITLYRFYVKPYIEEYDDKKIKRAFRKGMIRDINKSIQDYKNDTDPDD